LGDIEVVAEALPHFFGRCRFEKQLSAKIVRACSILSPWLAISSSGHDDT
jgi:hypothetical protein